MEQCGVQGLAQGPNSCADLTVTTPGIEPLTLQANNLILGLFQPGS